MFPTKFLDKPPRRQFQVFFLKIMRMKIQEQNSKHVHVSYVHKINYSKNEAISLSCLSLSLMLIYTCVLHISWHIHNSGEVITK